MTIPFCRSLSTIHSKLYLWMQTMNVCVCVNWFRNGQYSGFLWLHFDFSIYEHYTTTQNFHDIFRKCVIERKKCQKKNGKANKKQTIECTNYAAFVSVTTNRDGGSTKGSIRIVVSVRNIAGGRSSHKLHLKSTNCSLWTYVWIQEFYFSPSWSLSLSPSHKIIYIFLPFTLFLFWFVSLKTKMHYFVSV